MENSIVETAGFRKNRCCTDKILQKSPTINAESSITWLHLTNL
uniref:Uncharacterized protein n=1 Tax=Anguilla anguilla TaxID=7936 RepID=A0A0E9PYP5_ANGAN